MSKNNKNVTQIKQDYKFDTTDLITDNFCDNVNIISGSIIDYNCANILGAKKITSKNIFAIISDFDMIKSLDDIKDN